MGTRSIIFPQKSRDFCFIYRACARINRRISFVNDLPHKLFQHILQCNHADRSVKLIFDNREVAFLL